MSEPSKRLGFWLLLAFLFAAIVAGIIVSVYGPFPEKDVNNVEGRREFVESWRRDNPMSEIETLDDLETTLYFDDRRCSRRSLEDLVENEEFRAKLDERGFTRIECRNGATIDKPWITPPDVAPRRSRGVGPWD